MRNAGIIIQIFIGGLPSLGVVEAELLRLRLFGRSDRVLEWDLCDGHELSYEPGLSVRHRYPSPRCINFAIDDPANDCGQVIFIFASFTRLCSLTNGVGLKCVNICKTFRFPDKFQRQASRVARCQCPSLKCQCSNFMMSS